MRIFLALVFAIAGSAVWYLYTRPDPAPAPKAVPNYVRHISCPLCHGQRVILYSGGTQKENCTLCINAVGVAIGYRNVRVPPGSEICPNCQGMGLRIVNKSVRPPKVDNCTL